MNLTVTLLLVAQLGASPLALPPAPPESDEQQSVALLPAPFLPEAPPALDAPAPEFVPQRAPAPEIVPGEPAPHQEVIPGPPAELPPPEPAPYLEAPAHQVPGPAPQAYEPMGVESVYDFPVSNACRQSPPPPVVYCECEEEETCWCCCCLLAERSTGDMHQHYAYYPADHGYYYFAPYNYSKVAEQQQSAIRWGGDARWPYLTDGLARLYDSAPVAPCYLDPIPVTSSHQIKRNQLPSLESLLEPKSYDQDAH